MNHSKVINTLRYVVGKTLSQVKVKFTDSPFLEGNYGGEDVFFLKNISFSLGNGDGIMFWEDTLQHCETQIYVGCTGIR